MTTTTRTITTSRRTMMTTRRGKFSTASTVLLLCAALLLTKSCGILALSGDGNVELPGQADAWSETTTVSEGSGWEVTTTPTEEVDTTTINAEISTDDGLETTTAADAETTIGSNEPEQETTVKSDDDQTQTTTPSEEQPTTIPSENQSSSTPSGDQPTTTPIEDQSSSSPSDEQSTTTEAEIVIPTIAPTPPAPPVFECQTAGLFPHISGDCQRFHNCLLNPVTGQQLAIEMVCPPQMVFSATYDRCVRDLATCQNDDFICEIPGRFAGIDDSYYYNCLVSQRGGFHKYIVRCSSGQRFEPLLRGCWRYDWTQVGSGYPVLEASDLAAIKREQKQLKAEEKLRLKAEKNQEKLARKQQKLEEKLAKKAAKEQAKKEAKANKPKSVESVESQEQPSSNEK